MRNGADITPASALETCPVLSDTMEAAGGLAGHLRVVTRPGDLDGWITAVSLGDPETGPLADLFARFEAAGFGANRKAVAGSLLLRYGWAAGFHIAAYLATRRVAHIEDFALKFSSMTLVEGLWVRQARFTGLAEDPMAGRAGFTVVRDEAALRAKLLAGLIAFTGPLIESQHQWSKFSRHALWAMAVSSWAGQFVSIGERLGDADGVLAEARAVLALDPVIAKATPELYEVSDGFTTRVCQNRAACCLWFKGPRRSFCASCPIIPAAERLDRNLEWVKDQTAVVQRKRA